MRTFYSPGDLETPIVVCTSKTEGGARTKIAEALIDKGYQDPRKFIDFEVIEIEDDAILFDAP